MQRLNINDFEIFLELKVKNNQLNQAYIAGLMKLK